MSNYMEEQSIPTNKREETKTLVKGDAYRVPPSTHTHTHTHTREPQCFSVSNYLKEWIQSEFSKASVNDPDISPLLHTLAAQCPANEERTSSSGVILSPGFPGNYPNSQTCSWLLHMIPGGCHVTSVQLVQ